MSRGYTVHDHGHRVIPFVCFVQGDGGERRADPRSHTCITYTLAPWAAGGVGGVSIFIHSASSFPEVPFLCACCTWPPNLRIVSFVLYASLYLADIDMLPNSISFSLRSSSRPPCFMSDMHSVTMMINFYAFVNLPVGAIT